MNYKYVVLTISTIIVFSLTISCSSNSTQVAEKDNQKMIQLTSSAFTEGSSIPAKYTCDGEDISPSLKWSNIPVGTKSIALICEDPDSPIRNWVHWIIYNIPSTTIELEEGLPRSETATNGAKQGINDF